jgi:hypothetical protein
MTEDTTYPDPPHRLVEAAERDHHDANLQLNALIAGTRAVRNQHTTDLSLFLHVYTTIRPADPSRAATFAAVAVLRLMDAPPPADNGAPP